MFGIHARYYEPLIFGSGVREIGEADDAHAAGAT